MDDPPTALVIGYGNALLGDDGVGPLAADAVRSWNLGGVDTISTIQLTPELAEPLSVARLAVFIDARIGVPEDGPDVEVVPIEPTASGLSGQGHSGDPRKLLALACDVFGRYPPAWLVTVAADDVEIGEGLSPRARRGLEDALGRLAILISSDPVPDGRDHRLDPTKASNPLRTLSC